MKFEGTVHSWDSQRGFGYVRPEQGGVDIFLHISALQPKPARLQDGLRVSFEAVTADNGKKRAKNARLVRTAVRKPTLTPRRRPKHSGMSSLLAIPAFVALYLVAQLLWHPSLNIAACYAFLTVSTYVMYAIDKSAARNGAHRVPEKTLHMASLMGGWPGALIAQHHLRHKSSKSAFLQVFWMTVALNIVGFLLLASPLGKTFLEHITRGRM